MENKRVEDLESQIFLLGEQLQVAREKQMEITPIRNLALMLQKENGRLRLEVADKEKMPRSFVKRRKRNKIMQTKRKLSLMMIR